ncbi:MAG: cytochrome B, partial [Bacteriovorax sp.]|nr:cytochrome B [Rhizobacter sp.]
MQMQKRVRVWDLAQRLLHWVLVASVGLAALSVFTLSGAHQPAGWVALGAV